MERKREMLQADTETDIQTDREIGQVDDTQRAMCRADRHRQTERQTDI